MPLQITKPLIFIDLETTGVNIANDRIVEIAIVKRMPNGEEKKMRKFLNPTIPIPEQATAVHGITNEMVKDQPTFAAIANEIKQFIQNSDFAGFNSNRFDIPVLVEEFLRAGIDLDMEHTEFLDVYRIFQAMEPRNLSAAYKLYCNKTLENAHSAMADVEATVEVLDAQIDKYDVLGNTITSINKTIGEDKIVDYARRFVYDANGNIVFNFGKHKTKLVTDVLRAEPNYFDWMMRSDFELHTKKKLQEIFNKMKLMK